MNTFGPCSLSSTLPVETLEIIFLFASRTDILPFLCASSFFHTIASCRLYRYLSDLTPRQTVILIKTLSQSKIYPPLVRRLDVSLDHTHLTGNFFRMLNRAFRRLDKITSLTVEFLEYLTACDRTWIFDGCSFSLRSFTTTLRSDMMLASFLETQPNIDELCLRGLCCDQSFALDGAALPKLKNIRAIQSGPEFLREVISGRPVEVVWFFCDGKMTQSLDALLLSSVKIKRLSIMLFDCEEPSVLFPEVATRLPELESLYIVVLLPRHGPVLEMLCEAGQCLGQFKALRYITYMASGARTLVEEERMMAAEWHRRCPTLQTIILSKGTVWFHREGKWTSSDE